MLILFDQQNKASILALNVQENELKKYGSRIRRTIS